MSNQNAGAIVSKLGASCQAPPSALFFVQTRAGPGFALRSRPGSEPPGNLGCLCICEQIVDTRVDEKRIRR
jgi:hypothetical protein